MSEPGDPLLIVFWREPSKMAFTNSIYLLQMYCNPTGGVKTTHQMTRFRDAKVFTNWLQMKVDDHKIQSDYNKNYKIQKERTQHLVLSLRGETEHDTNDNVTIKGIASAW